MAAMAAMAVVTAMTVMTVMTVIMDERRLMRMTNSVEWYQPVGRPLEQKYTGTWKLWAANTEGRDAYQSTIKRGCVVICEHPSQ